MSLDATNNVTVKMFPESNDLDNTEMHYGPVQGHIDTVEKLK